MYFHQNAAGDIEPPGPQAYVGLRLQDQSWVSLGRHINAQACLLTIKPPEVQDFLILMPLFMATAAIELVTVQIAPYARALRDGPVKPFIRFRHSLQNFEHLGCYESYIDAVQETHRRLQAKDSVVFDYEKSRHWLRALTQLTTKLH